MRKSGNRVRIPAQLMETVLEIRAFAVRSTKPSQKNVLIDSRHRRHLVMHMNLRASRY